MKYILSILSILFILLIACSQTDVSIERQANQYRDKMHMYKYKSDLYLNEIRKTAKIISDADRTHTGVVNKLINYIMDLERERQYNLYQMRQYQRKLEKLSKENNERGY